MNTRIQKKMMGLRTNQIALFALLLLSSFVSPILTVFFAIYIFISSPSDRTAIVCSVGVAFSAALIAHGIVYKHDVDMTRWMVECDFYTGKNILSIWSSVNSDHNGLLVWNLLCWITGNSGDLRLLQSLAAFFGYGLISWIMMSGYVKKPVNSFVFVALLVFLFLAIPVQPIIGNVRSALGCLLCATAFCSRTSCNLKGSLVPLLLIFTACLIHYSMVLPLLIYIFQPLLTKKPIFSLLLSAFVLFVCLSAAPLLLEIDMLNNIPIVSNILQKAAFYSAGTQWDQAMAKDVFSIISHVLSLLLLGLICLKLICSNSHDDLSVITLVMIASVVVMEFTFVNVGNRLKYIPILMFSVLMLDDNKRGCIQNLKVSRWVDSLMFGSAFLVCLISMYRFIPSFNYFHVIAGAFLFPVMLI